MAISTAGLLLALAVVAGAAAPGGTTARSGSVRDGLIELSRRRVFFGHQSVGENLMDGVQRLATAEGQALNIVRVSGVAKIQPGTFAHALVPRNGDPLMKLGSFERALAEVGEVDVALVKFCYVDVNASTDARALFSAYQSTVERLEATYPNTTFVRVTIPLHTVQRGAKAMVKKMLGKDTTGVVENARREEFNDLLRAATRGKAPLFDLAVVEATGPDGKVETEPWQGRQVRALAPAYTTDGGHLNDAGKDRAARELVAVIASAPLRRQQAK